MNIAALIYTWHTDMGNTRVGPTLCASVKMIDAVVVVVVVETARASIHSCCQVSLEKGANAQISPSVAKA